MSAEPDVFARVIAVASFGIASLALWLNWQKHDRDLAAQRPQHGLTVERKGPRAWRVKLTVMNPKSTPIAWRKVEILSPRGAFLVSPIGQRHDIKSEYQLFASSSLTPYLFVEDYPKMIEPNKSETWEGLVVMDEWSGVRKTDTPFIIPIIDGYDMRPSRLRRIARKMWPHPIRM